MVRVVCISDTHTYHESVDLPHGDILVHAGDFTYRGKESEIRRFGRWFAEQPHTHKIVIAGNHDLSLQNNGLSAVRWLYNDNVNSKLIYLKDSAVTLEIDGCKIKVYGSPWQPEFFNWAFNLPRGPALEAVWSKIPDDTNILVTHGPPAGILDLCDHGERVGCVDLYNRIQQLSNLKLHVFGHIHESYGSEVINNTTFVNASSCNIRYSPVQPAIVVEI